MGPVGHGVVSAGIGAGIWAATGSVGAAPIALATGVFLDVDHILDFYVTYVKKDRGRVFVLAHGWEYATAGMVFMLAVWYHPWLLAAVLGLLGHVISDQIANRPKHPLGYSIAYRIRVGFRREPLFGNSEASLSDVFHKHIPLWSEIEPRLPIFVQKTLHQR